MSLRPSCASAAGGGGERAPLLAATVTAEEPRKRLGSHSRNPSDASMVSLGSGGNGQFDCNICLDTAYDPVVTACGHLYWCASRSSLTWLAHLGPSPAP